MPSPFEGPNGTVYLSSESASGSDFNDFAGSYIHEYGNILSIRYFGAYFIPGNKPIGQQGDTDTGANVENCVHPSGINY
jgi:hypothetical protein